jgi:hypothetical protein
MSTKICPTCADSFIAMLDSRVFCSPKCRASHQKKHGSTKQPTNKPEKIFKLKECATCFELFKPDHHSVRHCPQCKQNALTAKQAQRLERERTPLTSRMSASEVGHLPGKRHMPSRTIEEALAASPTTATELRIFCPDKKTIIFPRTAARMAILQNQNQ